MQISEILCKVEHFHFLDHDAESRRVESGWGRDSGLQKELSSKNPVAFHRDLANCEELELTNSSLSFALIYCYKSHIQRALKLVCCYGVPALQAFCQGPSVGSSHPHLATI